jgi:ribosomal protein L11 methyltransferase
MPYQALVLTVAAAEVEPLSDALVEAGALAVDVADADAGTPLENPLFAEPGEDPARAWQRARLQALFAADADVAAALAAACAAAGLPVPAAPPVTPVAEQDWVRLTQSQFTPIRITGRLWVVPSWCEPPEPSAINLLIDPGLAFGTGSHATTRLCLGWLAATLRGGERVIDYGCGSGILAIAALKLGAASATGVDIDPQALLAARDNAAHNSVAAEFLPAQGARLEPADVLVANILTNPLKLLAPMLAQLVCPGGRIALSGVLAQQAEEVAGVYRTFFELEPPRQDEDWVLIAGVRR